MPKTMKRDKQDKKKKQPKLIQNLKLAVCILVQFCVSGESFEKWDDMIQEAEER